MLTQNVFTRSGASQVPEALPFQQTHHIKHWAATGATVWLSSWLFANEWFSSLFAFICQNPSAFWGPDMQMKRARLNLFKPWSMALTPHVADITISVHCLGWGVLSERFLLALPTTKTFKDPTMFPGGGKPISCQRYPFLLTHGDNLRCLHLFNPVTWTWACESVSPGLLMLPL